MTRLIGRDYCPELPLSRPYAFLRVRLYNRGDSIADAAKQRKLKREFTLTSQLSSFIYWSDVGPEGAQEFEEQLRQKKLAEALVEAYAGTVTVEKAQKMIRKSVEAQRKADAIRGRASSYRTPSPRQPNRGGNRPRPRPQQRANRPQHGRPAGASVRRRPATSPRFNNGGRGGGRGGGRRRRP